MDKWCCHKTWSLENALNDFYSGGIIKLLKHRYSVSSVSSTTVPPTVAQDTVFGQLSPSLNFTNARHPSLSLSHPILSEAKDTKVLKCFLVPALTVKMQLLPMLWAIPLGRLPELQSQVLVLAPDVHSLFKILSLCSLYITATITPLTSFQPPLNKVLTGVF